MGTFALQPAMQYAITVQYIIALVGLRRLGFFFLDAE